MKRIVFGLFLSFMCLAIAVPAFAMPQGGTNEIEVNAGYFRALGTGGGTFNGDVMYGIYLDDPAWEIGLRQAFNYVQRRRASNFWTATTAPFVNYHIRGVMDGVVPFVGGQLGAVWNDDDFTGTVGPDAGLKFYMSDSTYMVTRYRYEWFFDKFETIDETAGANHVVTVGLGYNW